MLSCNGKLPFRYITGTMCGFLVRAIRDTNMIDGFEVPVLAPRDIMRFE